MMNVANVILFIIDPSEHCGYPMEVQLRLLEEVKGMVNVPVIIVANKSDLVTADVYATMSTADGTGVDAVLEEILTHKPAPEVRTRAVDIRSSLPQEAEDIVAFDGFIEDEDGVRKPKPKKAMKPRTKPVNS